MLLNLFICVSMSDSENLNHSSRRVKNKKNISMWRSQFKFLAVFWFDDMIRCSIVQTIVSLSLLWRGNLILYFSNGTLKNKNKKLFTMAPPRPISCRKAPYPNGKERQFLPNCPEFSSCLCRLISYLCRPLFHLSGLPLRVYKASSLRSQPPLLE